MPIASAKSSRRKPYSPVSFNPVTQLNIFRYFMLTFPIYLYTIVTLYLFNVFLSEDCGEFSMKHCVTNKH